MPDKRPSEWTEQDCEEYLTAVLEQAEYIYGYRPKHLEDPDDV